MNKRLVAAFAAYAVLAAIAFLVLKGLALYAVLILFGALALRTVIAHKAGWYSHIETDWPDTDSDAEQSPPTNPGEKF